MPPHDDLALYDRLARIRADVEAQIGRRIVGQRDVVERMLIALFAGGHCLFIGVPGLAKTLLVQSTAQTLGLDSGRIQFTPDLMPADVTGSEVLDEDRSTGHRALRFVPGPIFTNLLLADEINRTPPRTQAALLQAMQERQVTVGRQTYRLDRPFQVFATQNPIEQEGTYPLPEAQLDRFMFSIEVDYPSEAEEIEIVERTTGELGPAPEPVIDRDTLVALQDLVRSHLDHDDVPRFAVRLARATRPGPEAGEVVKRYVQWGAGPRASQYLLIGARVRAALHGRRNANIDDVRAVATSVLQHRIVPSFAAEAEGLRASEIVRRILSAVPAP
ncbi:MAG: MoxR family ATPase [Deltaproteobacteria bacterium]|nr:MoxR family ATPase [Deltaproteobacteria bacterium]